MKEVKAAEASDSDSGQASEEEDDEHQLKEKTTSKLVGKKSTEKQINGTFAQKPQNKTEEIHDILQILPVKQLVFSLITKITQGVANECGSIQLICQLFS